MGCSLLLSMGDLTQTLMTTPAKSWYVYSFFQAVVCLSHKDISNGDIRTEDESESRVTHNKDGRDAPFQPQLPPPPRQK